MMRRPGVHRGQRRPRSRVRGFTLVELIVAMLVMTVGILALASTAGVVTKMMTDGSQRTIAANVAQARFEVMRNRLCTSLAPGTATTRNVKEKWAASQAAPKLGLVVDSLFFKTWSGHSSSALEYRSYVSCR